MMNSVHASVILLMLFQVPATVAADEPTAPALLPRETVIYAEIPHPEKVLSTILDHPLRAQIESHELYQQATQSQQYRNFLTGRKMFEIQMGMEWREAITAITSGGIFVGFEPVSNGVALLVRGRDAATMETLRSKLLELTRLNKPQQNAGDNEYRGISTYRNDGFAAAVVGRWLVVVNKPELGKSILDGLLDAADGSRKRDLEETLAASPTFAAAMSQRSTDTAAWGFVDLEAVRTSQKVQKALEGKAQNPLAEILAGGIQSLLRQTPYVTAEMQLEQYSASLALSVPWDGSGIPEEREWFFGPDSAGRAPALPKVPETLAQVGMWRDISQMWLRAGDLFDENMNDQLAAADSSLTTLFAGRDFGEEILGSFQPQIGLIVTRQQFGDRMPQPAIRLPAFALVLELRDPERMTRELRRTFQSMIGFFNVIGAMEGRPQLEMDMRRIGEAELVTSSYLPEDDERDSMTAPIVFNFSPTVAFLHGRMFLSSTQQLAEQLVQAEPSTPDESPTVTNSFLNMSASVLRQVLADNREQLIAQNMLEEGNTRDEAEGQISLLLQLVDYFDGIDLRLARDGSALQLKGRLSLVSPETQVKEQPAP